MNNVSLTGRLAAQPELKKTPDDVSVCSFAIAVKRPKTSEKVDFINIVVWRQTAEFVCRYFGKGDMIALTGYIINRRWTDKDGNKHSSVEVVAENAEFCGKKTADGGNDTVDGLRMKPSQEATWGTGDDFVPLADDDMPF